MMIVFMNYSIENLTQRFIMRSKKLSQLQDNLLQRTIASVQQKDSVDAGVGAGSRNYRKSC